MTKSETNLKLLEQKVVVVIRGNSLEEALQSSQACIAGGITAIEVAYTNTKATQVIEALSEQYDASNPDVIIGAGTVLDAETARAAILAGAKFIVSPSFNPDTARLCNRYAIPYYPGCMTLTEITNALEAGCEIVKIFPGGTLGTSFISSLKSPLPQVQVMVTGGVNLDNATDWFKAGVDAIGIGGEFNKLSAIGEFDKITEMAKEYIKRVR
ncbi:bifunctional 4-hydroxy-2-oxoglutarate aldolase/2-dehydro-3-deoxy-phosphogluconate aldolase [Streptococcus ovis]|uniref:bifunctional 4-hydroxy-2-oxoglutarate aldolase/2-dehydro-3-deoxy-phosphogluconate aldolase n=1 Tax=Streptococcus ovis TaxID=82806 RepID=UPI00037B3487|nr:bifunctional 4-hydroxy-2-oxoglutarate aldolase/2-dehydro-3-deoxy-phosphogluconate aldolase [Streptococcus ovis]